MRNLTSEVRNQQIEWRRTKVLELANEGYNQTEICQKLQLDKSTVNRDIQFLRQQSQENLQKHIHEAVPEEYQKTLLKKLKRIALDNDMSLAALALEAFEDVIKKYEK